MSRSLLWNFFTKETDNHDYAICNLCAVKICRKGGSTTAMGNHLRIKHKSVILSSASGQSAMKPKVQPTLSQSLMKSSRSRPTQFRRPLDKSETERLRRALAWMCAVDVRPISIVQGLGFRNYSRLMNANFVVPSRKTVSSYIAKIYQEGHEELKVEIAGTPVGLTTDLWTSNAQEGYITVTAQYITASWEQKTRVLATRVMEDRHTGEKIAEQIHKIMAEFGVPSVTAICTDNAANMKTCCSEGDLIRIPCFAHTLQLAINDGLNMGHKGKGQGSIQRALGKARRLITFFNHSIPGRHICD